MGVQSQRELQNRTSTYTTTNIGDPVADTMQTLDNVKDMIRALESDNKVWEGNFKKAVQEKLTLMNEVTDLKKKLAQEKGLNKVQYDQRALLVNFDGSIKNTTVYAGPDGPRRDFRQVELGWLSPHSLEIGSVHLPHRERHYRLAFSQPGLHVYQELA
jgi:hypothetical protein